MSRALCMIRRCLMFVRIIPRSAFHQLPEPRDSEFCRAVNHENANWSVTAITFRDPLENLLLTFVIRKEESLPEKSGWLRLWDFNRVLRFLPTDARLVSPIIWLSITCKWEKRSCEGARGLHLLSYNQFYESIESVTLSLYLIRTKFLYCMIITYKCMITQGYI